jgi:hypothetical protein
MRIRFSKLNAVFLAKRVPFTEKGPFLPRLNMQKSPSRAYALSRNAAAPRKEKSELLDSGRNIVSQTDERFFVHKRHPIL